MSFGLYSGAYHPVSVVLFFVSNTERAVWVFKDYTFYDGLFVWFIDFVDDVPGFCGC